MAIGLRRKLRIETDQVDGRMITRLFIGDEELPATPELRRAVAQLAAGAPVIDARRLYGAGVLEHIEDPTFREEQRVRLDPKATLNLALRAAQVTLPHPDGPRVRSVRPEASLPIDLFVAPFKLRPTLDLAHQVRTAWYRLLAQATGRGEAIDREDAAARLAAVATEMVRTRPDLQPVWDVEGDRLIPIGPLQDDTWHYPLATVSLHGDRRAAMASRRSAHAVTLNPHSELAAAEDELAGIGRLLGALMRDAGSDALDGPLEGATAAVTQVFRELVKAELLADVADRLGLADGLSPGQVRHLGHATLLADLGGAHVLIDPWFVPASERDLEQPPALCDLPELAGIFFTHHHWDHVHLETLLKLDKAIPLYVPAQPEGPVVPRTARLLQALGFERVEVLAHGEQVRVGEGFVEAAPFLGEDPTGLGFGANTYLLGHREQRAWVHVDSGPDRQGRSSVTEGVAAALQEKHGPIGTVYATRRQERGTMVEFDWTFLLQPFAAWTQPTENCATGAAFLGELAAACGAKSVVLYSEGGASWYPESTDFLRRGPEAAMDRVYEAGWDALDAIEAAVSAAGAGLVLSNPRDVHTMGE